MGQKRKFLNQKGGAFPIIPIRLARTLNALGSILFWGNYQSDPSMKKMTMVEEAVLDRLRQKQIGQEIQQPELSARVKIRTQIEDTLSNSKLTDTENLDILERAQEKHIKLPNSMSTTKTPIVDERGPAPASIDVTPSEPPMFQAVNLPANPQKKFNKFPKFVE